MEVMYVALCHQHKRKKKQPTKVDMPIIEHRLVGKCLNSLGMGWWTIDQTLVNVHNVTYDQTSNKRHLCSTISTLLTNNL
jgi:hypothetical protein